MVYLGASLAAAEAVATSSAILQQLRRQPSGEVLQYSRPGVSVLALHYLCLGSLTNSCGKCCSPAAVLIPRYIHLLPSNCAYLLFMVPGGARRGF